MSQSRIRSFFTAVPDDAYAAQLQRARDEHSAACEQQQYREALLRAHHRMQREAGEKRGVGRPRKRPITVISINNSNHCSVSTGDITVSVDPTSPVDSLSTAATATTVAAATAATAATNTTATATAVATNPAKRARQWVDWLV